jgi:hypothetical protein
MKSTRAFGLLTVLVLLASPLTALAQEEPQWTEFVSADGKLTISYPADWFLVENGADMGLPGVQITNTEAALTSTTGLGQDEVGIVVLLLPHEILPLLGIELPAEGEQMAPEDLVSQITAVFIITSETTSAAPGEPTPVPTPELGEPVVVDLTDDLQAGYMTLTGEDGDGAVIAYEQDGIIVLVVAASAMGSYTDEFDAAALAVAGSVRYTGTSADLMQLMMGASGTSGAGSTEPLPEPTLEPDIEPTAAPASP